MKIGSTYQRSSTVHDVWAVVRFNPETVSMVNLRTGDLARVEAGSTLIPVDFDYSTLPVVHAGELIDGARTNLHSSRRFGLRTVTGTIDGVAHSEVTYGSPRLEVIVLATYSAPAPARSALETEYDRLIVTSRATNDAAEASLNEIAERHGLSA